MTKFSSPVFKNILAMYSRVLFLVLFLFPVAGIAQTRVILDTDMDSDVDDVAALAMLHRMVFEKQVELAGVIVTSDDPYAPLCADAINTYFGNGRIPIGFLKTQPLLVNSSKYTRQLSVSFPHRLKSYKDARESADLYRELLSKAADNSVVIITIGHLSSLESLLKSAPDHYSPLNGKELALRKVSKWLCMGGMFPEGKEANFYRPDLPSTVYCLREWSKPVIFAGWEIGTQIVSGGTDLRQELSAESPVYKALELYNHFAGRPSWDQSAVLLLNPGYEQYFSLVSNGFCLIEGDGSNRWIPGVRSNQSYVTIKDGVDPKQIAKLIDAMMIKK
jgi:purine nucleosidase